MRELFEMEVVCHGFDRFAIGDAVISPCQAQLPHPMTHGHAVGAIEPALECAQGDVAERRKSVRTEFGLYRESFPSVFGHSLFPLFVVENSIATCMPATFWKRPMTANQRLT